MPKLWDDTIEAHRRAVIDATLDSTAALVAEHGLRGVTMSQIAAATGIGRATLYKYFPDVGSILSAWHDRQVKQHLAQLVAIRDGVTDVGERLAEILTAFAQILRGARARHDIDVDLIGKLHDTGQVGAARHELHTMIAGLLHDAAAAGSVRTDVPVEELASYCLHALTGAANLHSDAGVDRLVGLILSGLAGPH